MHAAIFMALITFNRLYSLFVYCLSHFMLLECKIHEKGDMSGLILLIFFNDLEE